MPPIPHSSIPYSMLKTVHSIPGRIRLRVPELKENSTYASQLQATLSTWPGVRHVRINQLSASLVVGYAPEVLQEGQIRQTVEDWIEKISQNLTPEPHPALPSQDSSEGWSSLRLPLVATSLALLSRTLPRWVGLRPVTTIAFLLIAFPVAKRAWQSIVNEQRLNIDCLDFLALSLNAWQGKQVTPMMVILLHELGDIIREQTARATEVRTADLQEAIGRFAWVKLEEDQPPQQIPSDRVEVGQTVIVYPGEQIPVDGTVLRGEGVIDQQQLTGEAMPVVRQEGELVLASTLLRSGQLYLRADRVGNQTRAALSLALLQKAPVHDTRMANYAEKIADRLILPSLFLAALVWLTTGDPSRAAAILTLDFVTGIRVSIPTAFLGALNHTTRHGILVRSGRTLEQLAEVDTVVFDKTGTLTQGIVTVSGITPFNGSSEERVLQLAAAAEQRLNHPVAEAIVDYAHQKGVTIPSRGEWFYELGLGVRAQIEGQEVLVGSQRFLHQAGIEWESVDGRQVETQIDTPSEIYVACEQQFQGVIHYRDPLRPESDRLIQTLQKSYGIDVHLLTGDRPQRAAQVAQELGIPTSQVYAEAFPDDKARILRDLHRSGRTVAFVGDGLNDSVALAYADVAVSFEQGSEIARETADVVLMNNNLLDLLEAISIARQTRNLIDQNIALVVAPNLAALGLASSVGLHPLLATAIHNGSAIAAGVNSLRPLVEHQLTVKS
ncbi:MAG: heavy metal translocating P-type ATPase [Roseofilum sp. SBFL]|nr:heavy metal translocating P-type ATPase [Roseofilum sp. SID3]MBP0026385.1 heavy metal translocating P-type ATPase [Roseofilum sp. SID2]MBP0038216.1 heavy metal translocating P-type ATPase [Roseofilum sp. SID1]MBP0040863.1 heavy metal translocating P-type ATPase [Roseofilum sp. SBFL]